MAFRASPNKSVCQSICLSLREQAYRSIRLKSQVVAMTITAPCLSCTSLPLLELDMSMSESDRPFLFLFLLPRTLSLWLSWWRVRDDASPSISTSSVLSSRSRAWWAVLLLPDLTPSFPSDSPAVAPLPRMISKLSSSKKHGAISRAVEWHEVRDFAFEWGCKYRRMNFSKSSHALFGRS